MIIEGVSDSSPGYSERLVWQPQKGPQEALVNCPITLIGYGGARGGGKTDGVLGKFAIKQEQLGDAFNAIFFRKELPQADDLIERAKQIYLPLNAHWQDQNCINIGGGRTTTNATNLIESSIRRNAIDPRRKF